MPKVKETRVALTGAAALKAAPKMSETTRKAPPHSEEVQTVSDSDESNSDSSSGHSSGSESDAEKRKNTKKPKPSKVKETEPNSPPVPDDSSDDSDSDANLDRAVAQAKTQKNAAKKAPAIVTPNGAALKTSKPAKASKSSEKVSESDDSSEDESDSDVEMAEADKPAPAPRAAGQASASETTATAIVPPLPFAPPPGYKALNTKSALAKTANSLFDPSTISSKQIWHITAPSSVPLSSIKSVSLSAIQSHQTVLSHDGTDYNLAEEPTNNARVLLPSSRSDAYTTVEVPVSKTLHLQQTIRLPNLSAYQTDPNTGSNAAASLRTPAVSAPRPQPKGMKMRYKPPGFGDEDPGMIGSSEDESDANAKQVEKSAKEARSKRKRDEKEADETPKDKKRKKAAEAAEKLAEGTRAEVPQTSEEKARKKAEKKDKKKVKK
jgi:hypothetical protein